MPIRSKERSIWSTACQSHKSSPWADREVAKHIMLAADKDKLWMTDKLNSNGVRTAVIHALMHTRGLTARLWKQCLSLGAAESGDNLVVVMDSKDGWQGKVVFDIQRHRQHMGFFQDWQRMNTMPEWFTVEPDKKYEVTEPGSGQTVIHTRTPLHEGLTLALAQGTELPLQITQR